MLHIAIMASKPVQISLDTKLLQTIDRDPETRSHGRSAFIRSAVSLYLEAKRRRSVDAAIRRGYGDKSKELLGEIEDLIGAQAWPGE